MHSNQHQVEQNVIPDSSKSATHQYRDPVLNQTEQNIPLATSPNDFTVIWRNLTYRVDSRPWYTKLKEHCFGYRTGKSANNVNVNEGYGSDSDSSLSSSNPKKKVILDQLCGDAKSRQLTGILGPSGAGKSTLLCCLFQNRTDGTKGQILVDREIKGKLKVCFIPQHDYLNEFLTVREDLIFVSRLKTNRVGRLRTRPDGDNSRSPTGNQNLSQSETNLYVKQVGGKSETSIDHEANAVRVAELLGLINCLDVKIKNISGGQKKRLSIARELMSKPDVLILDEPTTGLDSLTCHKTMMVLRDLAHLSPHPMAVIVTIHQPPKAVFKLFDKTYFLSRGGHVIFEGHPNKVVETLSSVARVQMPVPNYNPATFLIEMATDEAQAGTVEWLAAHQRASFHEKYDNAYLNRLVRAKPGNTSQNWSFCNLKDKNSVYSLRSATSEISPTTETINVTQMQAERGPSTETAVKECQDSNGVSGTLDKNDYFISYELRDCLSSHSSSVIESFRHIFILTHRSWLSVIRNPSMTRSRFVFHAVLPFIMLLVFSDGSGSINNCPALETELDMGSMAKSLRDGLVSKNLDQIRLGAQNMSFFFILLYGFGINIISCTASFYPLTMNMFRKETINGLYAPGPYFIGQMLAELPLEIFLPIMSILLSYPLTNQEPSYLGWRMFTVAFIVFLTCYAIHAVGLLCGAIFINNVNLSVVFGQVLLFPSCMLSGFLIRPCRMPYWMQIMTYSSLFRLGLLGIMATRYGFNVCNCDEESLSQEIGFSGMPANVKHVLEYMFPKNESSPDDFHVTDMFESLGKSFVKAQTFALDIKSCDDVKPYTMTMFSVEDYDVIVSITGLLTLIVIVKMITFSVMKSFPHRMN